MNAKNENLHRNYLRAKALSEYVEQPLKNAHSTVEDFLKDKFGMVEGEAAWVLEAYQHAPGLIDGCLAEVKAKEDQIDALQVDLGNLRAANVTLREKLDTYTKRTLEMPSTLGHSGYLLAKDLHGFFTTNVREAYKDVGSYLRNRGLGVSDSDLYVDGYKGAQGLIQGCLQTVAEKEAEIIDMAQENHEQRQQIEVLQADLAKLQAENIALKEKLAPTPISHAVHAHAMEHWPVVREMWAYANTSSDCLSMEAHLVKVLGLDRDVARYYADTYRSAAGLIGACCAEIDRMREAAEEVPQESLESPSLTGDGEIETIAEVWEMLQDLADEEARDRVVRYLGERCGIALS